MLGMFRALWSYRDFVLGSVKREFQSKYRNSMLGAAWNLINPLAMIVVYTVIFSQIMQTRLPGVEKSFAYSIYLCSGILAWNLFSEIVSRSQSMFLDNANMIKKLNFPRICLPAIVASSALLNFFIVFGLFAVFLFLSGNFPGPVFAGLVPVLVLLVLFAIGLGLVLGVLNVFFRDVGQFFSIFITFWFWLTPVVYPAEILPEQVKKILWWNPMGAIVASLQGVFVRGVWPNWGDLVYPLVWSVLLCLLGLHLFRARSAEIADEI